MTKLRYLIAVVAALVAIFGLAVVANAATVEECQAKIDALATQTETADFFGQNAETTRANLLAKLDDASTKLAEGKFTDAIQKLTDFRTTVEELSTDTKPKIDAEDAATSIAGANDAIACIAELQAATTTTTTAAA